MRILELLRTLRSVTDLPDFTDREAVRTWLLRLCDIGQLVTIRTPTPADDKALAFLERQISNPALFGPIFDLLTAMLAAEPGAPVCMAPPELTASAEAAGVNPVTILAIVEAVAALIKIIRERRGK